MNAERIFLIALIVVALLASIPQIAVDPQIWGAILAIGGLANGVMAKSQEVVQRILIYVLAVTLPVFDDSLTAIWVVGPWFDTLFDNVAIGIQGTAVGLFVMAIVARLQGTQPASS